MLAECYFIAIRISNTKGTTEYHDGVEWVSKLGEVDDDGWQCFVECFDLRFAAQAVCDAWAKEDTKHRYEVKTLRFALEDPK